MIELLEREKSSLDGYKEILSSDTIKLWLKWGSQFEGTHPLIKAKYVFEGAIEPAEFLYFLQDGRREWDGNVILLEEVARITREVNVVHYAVKPPIFFMKAKDFVEKRVRFVDNGVYYGYSSSTPNGALPPTDRYQRCETIYSGSVLTTEGGSLVYYTFSQVDLKVWCAVLNPG